MASQSSSSKCSFITLCTSSAGAAYHLLPFAAIVEPNAKGVTVLPSSMSTDCSSTTALAGPRAEPRHCSSRQSSCRLGYAWCMSQPGCRSSAASKTLWGFEGVWRGFNSWWWNRARTLHCTKQRSNTFALKRNMKNCESCNAVVSWERTAGGNTCPESGRCSRTAAEHLILQSKYDVFLKRFPYT